MILQVQLQFVVSLVSRKGEILVLELCKAKKFLFDFVYEKIEKRLKVPL